jgi:hypothetical protein
MTTDWIQSIVIILLFSCFMLVDSLNGGIKSIQQNWNMYRCNPIIMPFIGFVAPEGSTVSTEENFQFCVQNMMATFAPALTQPLSYLQSMTVDMMGTLNHSVSSSNKQSSSLRFSLSGIIGSIYDVFLNVVVEFNIIVIKLLDTQGKLSGIIATLMYLMTAVQYTILSMYNGIPGQMIKVLSKK